MGSGFRPNDGMSGLSGSASDLRRDFAPALAMQRAQAKPHGPAYIADIDDRLVLQHFDRAGFGHRGGDGADGSHQILPVRANAHR
jgi:hypothetical protein